MRFLKRFTRRLLLLINILVAAVFIFTSFTVPNLSAESFWPVSFLGLFFPVTLALVLFFFLFWLVFYIKYSLLSLISVMICWKFVSVFFAFHPFVKSQELNRETSMTVMSYNVRYFKDFNHTLRENARLRNDIMNLIEQQDPDILCLQEFYTSENPNDFDNKTYVSQKMNLPYRYFSSDHNYQNNHSGVIIFSRYPVIGAGKIKLLKNSERESAVFADVIKGRDTIRIFTVHLQSIYLNRKDLRSIKNIKLQEDSDLVASKRILGKLRRAFIKREQQANIVSEKIRESRYPVILCGDFNDPPNSYAYFKIKGDLQDAFLKKGFGIGRTYSGISPTLRIDYIFTSPVFKINKFYTIKKALSDHYPIVAEVTIRRKVPATGSD